MTRRAETDSTCAVTDWRIAAVRTLELFGRQRCEGWDIWGDDVDRFEAGA